MIRSARQRISPSVHVNSPIVSHRLIIRAAGGVDDAPQLLGDPQLPSLAPRKSPGPIPTPADTAPREAIRRPRRMQSADSAICPPDAASGKRALSPTAMNLRPSHFARPIGGDNPARRQRPIPDRRTGKPQNGHGTSLTGVMAQNLPISPRSASGLSAAMGRDRFPRERQSAERRQPPRSGRRRPKLTHPTRFAA